MKVQGDYSTKSRMSFSFVDPHINSIEPSKGPKAGGTRLTIWGLHMDAGSHMEAYLGTMPCQVVSRSSNKAECITSARFSQGDERLRVRFDNGERPFNGMNRTRTQVNTLDSII